jgi:hypothetical protein
VPSSLQKRRLSMLFRVIRRVRCGVLSIKITFEQSDEMPCEMMNDHADEVECAVRDLYESTDKPPEMVAFEIVDKYRRVTWAEVEDEETGDSVACECED